MSYVIQTTDDFERCFKRLSKRHRSLVDDMQTFRNNLQENPFQGVELCPNIRKIRMPITSKGRGKAGSARVITANAIIAQSEGRIALLTIYDKADYTTVDLRVVKQMARDLGFDVTG